MVVTVLILILVTLDLLMTLSFLSDTEKSQKIDKELTDALNRNSESNEETLRWAKEVYEKTIQEVNENGKQRKPRKPREPRELSDSK